MHLLFLSSISLLTMKNETDKIVYKFMTFIIYNLTSFIVGIKKAEAEAGCTCEVGRRAKKILLLDDKENCRYHPVANMGERERRPVEIKG